MIWLQRKTQQWQAVSADGSGSMISQRNVTDNCKTICWSPCHITWNSTPLCACYFLAPPAGVTQPLTAGGAGWQCVGICMERHTLWAGSTRWGWKTMSNPPGCDYFWTFWPLFDLNVSRSARWASSSQIKNQTKILKNNAWFIYERYLKRGPNPHNPPNYAKNKPSCYEI